MNQTVTRVVLFDMDGLLVETESLKSLMWIWLLAQLGVTQPTLNESGTVNTVGIPTSEQIAEFQKKYGVLITKELYAQGRNRYTDILKTCELQPMPGVKPLIRALRLFPAKLKLGVVSGSDHNQIGIILNRLVLASSFDVTVSGKDVDRPKPAPDVYLKAALTLGIDPVDCVVLEDSEAGVVSAAEAGMKVIAVPNRLTATQDFSRSRLIAESLEQVTPLLIFQL